MSYIGGTRIVENLNIKEDKYKSLKLRLTKYQVLELN